MVKIKNKHKLSWIIVVIVLLIAIATYLAIAWQNNILPFSGLESQHESQSTKDRDEETETKTSTTKGSDSSSYSQNNRESEKDLPVQYEGESISSSDSLSGTINYKEVIDSQLVLRTTINQPLSSGLCRLRLTHSGSGRVVSQQANIIPNPSSATCEGFNVSTTELGSGEWQIEVQVSSGNRAGILTGSVNL